MKDEKYYARFKHFLRINLDKVESFRIIKEWLAEREKIIDIGCGIGYLTNYIGAAGLDTNAYAVSKAKTYFPKTAFFHGDLTSLNLKPKSIDAFLCYNVLEHIPDSQREKLFKEIKRTLRGKGFIVAGYIDEDYFVNKIKSLLIKHQVSSDSTDLVSWKLKDFIGEIERHFRIVKSKRTSPYGRYPSVFKYLKGELILMAEPK